MEGKYQILTVCLVYQLKKNLFNNLKSEHPIRASKKSQNHIFKFLINSPSEKPGTQKLIARHVFNCFFHMTYPDYASFLDCIRFTQPTQQQVDRMQEGTMKGAQRMNNIVVDHLFSCIRPLSTPSCLIKICK